MTWQELSEENLRAARKLLDAGLYRASVGRSYYAVYCAVTAELVKRNVSFPFGWHNPAHDQLRGLVQNNLPLSDTVRRQLRSTLLNLRTVREDAEYRPAAIDNRELAVQSIQDAVLAINDLERPHE